MTFRPTLKIGKLAEGESQFGTAVSFNKSELVIIQTALCVAGDCLIEQAGWCGDNASEQELRAEASEYYDLYNKLNNL